MDELYLEINPEELEIIENRMAVFDFPAIHLGKQHIYFNAKAFPYIPEYIKWYASPEYIIGLPAIGKSKYSFKTRITSEFTRATTFPIRMKKEKCVKSGFYKLYKYKNGIAFKRYEQIIPVDEVER